MRTPTAGRWREIEPHLDRALELEGAERESYLVELTARDAMLAGEVRKLLAREREVGEERFLETGPPLGGLLPGAAFARAGSTLGAYTLESPLGEGGMGAVWLARRSDGTFEGKVAVKLVRPGLDSRRVLARFEAERQTLARLNHPNIARVLDAGSAPDGRPFFAMEYVEGTSLHEYCDAGRLGLRERLGLFLDVCSGVQHAHRNGIIHRDLKPSNLLIAEQDGRAVPKIIDFGIAKAVGPGPRDTDQVTRQGDWLGTPAYMSPEQWGTTGGAVDTRSDVYSLGVILHELLVGVRPPSVQAPESTARTAPPTARFATLGDEREAVASRRGTDAPGLVRAIRGDLDWIVVKAIEREPDRRYETVAALADDVRACLEDRPVRAGPPSFVYRARKFVRRHRAAVAAAAVALAALVAGGTLAAVAYSRAVVAERTASAERDKASAINAFLEETFSSADPFAGEGSGRDTTVVQALGEAVKRLETSFPGQPAIRAAVLQTIGGTYLQLGRVPEAVPLLEEAVAIRRTLGPSAEGELAQSLTALGDGLGGLSRLEDAKARLVEALAIGRRISPAGSPDLARTIAVFADTLQHAGDRAAATKEYEEAVAMCRRLLGPDAAETWRLEAAFAQLLYESSELDRAEPILRDVAERQRTVEPGNPRRADTLETLAALLDSKARLEEAETLEREALAIRQKALGPQHPQTCDSLFELAWIVRRRGHLDEAERLLREAIEGNRAGGGPSFSRAGYLGDLAGVLAQRDDNKAAEAAYQEALDIYRRDAGPDHPNLATTLLNLGILQARMGQLKEAESSQREALRIQVARLGAESREAAEAREGLADTLAKEKRWGEAVEEATAAVAIYGKDLGPEDETTLRARAFRARDLRGAGRLAEAEREVRAVHDRASSLFGPSHEVTRISARVLAELLRVTGRAGEAARYEPGPRK